MAFPNPFTNPEFFQQVILGGRPIKATLVAIDGVKIEDEWQEQRPTGNSGATNVFKGTKPAGPAKLTFWAVDAEEVDDLREVYELLEPEPGTAMSSAGTTTGSPGSAAYGRSYTSTSSASSPRAGAPITAESLLAQAEAQLAALQSGGSSTSSAGSSTSSSSGARSPAPTQSPGPKPPTLSIKNGFLNYVGFTDCSRKSWEGPTWLKANGAYEVVIELVLQKAPAKAAVGAASPRKPDTSAKRITLDNIGSVLNAWWNDPASAANAKAAQMGAE